MTNINEKQSSLIQDLKNVRDLLDRTYMPLRRLLKAGPHNSDLTPEFQNLVTEFLTDLQLFSELKAGLHLSTVMDKPHDAYPEGPKKNKELPNASQRRNSSNAYDFLLLEGLTQQPAFKFPIGQSNLFDLASIYNPQSKKPSLVSKLNRWKNKKRWVNWKLPDQIELTKEGATERNRLLELAKRDGKIPQIEGAFKKAWKIDVHIT